MANDWNRVLLGEVLTARQEKPSPVDLDSGAIRIVSKIGFNDGKVQLRISGDTKTGMILVRPGDLIVSGINAVKGAIAIYDEKAIAPIAATIHYGSYIPNRERVDIHFLWWLLRSQVFREILLQNLPGGIKSELKPQRFLSVPVPLPSLPEQQRIVARVDVLARRVEEARGLRRAAVEEAEALPNSVLSTIVTELGARFGTRALDELLVEACYGTSVKCDAERSIDTIPVLRIPNVASEKVSLANLKFGTLNESELAKTRLTQGDILVVRTNGSRDLVGRCAVVPGLPEVMSFASYMIRLRCNQEMIYSNFLQLVLHQQRTAGDLIDFARTTAGQYNVSLGRLRNTKIPIPPLTDQRRIVAYLDGLQTKVDELRRLQAATQKELDALMPSILAKAFAGEL